MELKFVIPNMEKTFGNLEFAGEDKVVQRRINGRLTVLSRSYNLYSDVQRADDIVVVLPAEAGEKVSYPNPIAIPINGGWRYNYGNMFYVQLVTQYLVTTEFDDDTVQAIMDEALKYEGWRYVYGGASPTTSFDCSGLTQWTYGKAGINLPRTAQQQYDVTQHIPLSEAQAGDLVFFHSTYNAGSYITHVGIYLGNNRMFHAGDPIGYADLTSPYWQQHLVGAGRIKQ